MTTARASFLSAPRCISTTIDVDQLNAAAVAQTFTLGLQIPAGALVISRYLNLATEFSGGGAGSVIVDFGDQAQAQGWYTEENIFTGAGAGFKVQPAVTGVYLGGDSLGTAVTRAPAADCLAPARTITVTITSNVNVNLLTAGSLGVNVFYVEQAAGDLPA